MAFNLAEMLTSGKDYANQIVKNLKALGKLLMNRDFNVLYRHKGHTETHQVAVDASNLDGQSHNYKTSRAGKHNL